MIISIFASVGCQNLGDELILKNEIKLLEKEYGKDTKFIVFTYDKNNPFFISENIFYKEYFPIGIRNKKNFFRNIKNFFTFIFTVVKSDLIVLGGGGIIYDKEVQKGKMPLDLWLKRVRIFNFFRKKYVFYRGGISISNEKNLRKVKKIFEKAFYIEVRDNYSFELLKNLGIKSQIKLDPVFFDLGSLVIKKSIVGIIPSFKFNKGYLKNLDLKNKKIGLAIRSGYFVQSSKISNRMEEGIINEILNYLLGENCKIVLLPHSFHFNDEMANDLVFMNKFVGKKDIMIKTNMQDVYNVYKNLEIDFCIAMRLHSIILSHVYKIPFLGVSYSTKTDEVLNYLINKN